MIENMKAAIFRSHGSVENLEITEVNTPVIRDDEILINVKAAALNRLDIWVRNGSPALSIPLPHVGGSDFAGTVSEIGSKVTQFDVGDRVVANAGLSCKKCNNCLKGEHSLCQSFKLLGEHVWGGLAEFVKVPETNVIRLPDHIGFDTAAAASLTCLTAYRMIKNQARIRSTDNILVIGAGGGIGTISVQIAKYYGNKVFALTSTKEKAEKLIKLGADHVINYKDNPDWDRELWQLTEKIGVDIVVDSVGSVVWKKALKSLAKGGRLVTCGATSGIRGETNIALLFWKQLSIIGSTMASDNEFREAMSLVFDINILPVIDSKYPLEQIQDAHRRLESGRHMGKIVIQIG